MCCPFRISGLRFEFGQYLNSNLLRGSGSGILLNLIPEPQVQNQVRARFERFGNQTMASLQRVAHLQVVVVVVVVVDVGMQQSHQTLLMDIHCYNMC